jgi:hypothetical protein
VALDIIKGRKIKRKELMTGKKYIKLDLDTLLEVNSPDMENILPALADFIEETDFKIRIALFIYFILFFPIINFPFRIFCNLTNNVRHLLVGCSVRICCF